MRRLIGLVALVCLLALIAVPAFAQDGSAAAIGTERIAIDPAQRAVIKERLDALKGIDAQIRTLGQSLKAGRDANQSLLKSVVSGIRAQLGALSKQERQAKRDAVQPMIDNVKALREQTKQVMADIRSLQQQAKTVQGELRAAKQAKDADGVVASLTKLQGLKAQVAAGMQRALEVERQISASLSSLK